MTTALKISYHLLLLASLLLVLNMAIPHHHHQYEVCCADVHHAGSDAGHGHSPDDHKDTECEDNHSDNEHCQQNGYFLIPGNKDSFGKSKQIVDQNVASFYTHTINSKTHLLISPSIAEHLFRPDQTVLDVKSLSRALRAPPAC